MRYYSNQATPPRVEKKESIMQLIKTVTIPRFDRKGENFYCPKACPYNLMSFLHRQGGLGCEHNLSIKDEDWNYSPGPNCPGLPDKTVRVEYVRKEA